MDWAEVAQVNLWAIEVLWLWQTKFTTLFGGVGEQTLTLTGVVRTTNLWLIVGFVALHGVLHKGGLGVVEGLLWV